MKVAGENGVAAYGSIMYANFIFIAVLSDILLEVRQSSAIIMVPAITVS